MATECHPRPGDDGEGIVAPLNQCDNKNYNDDNCDGHATDQQAAGRPCAVRCLVYLLGKGPEAPGVRARILLKLRHVDDFSWSSGHRGSESPDGREVTVEQA
jgi:hypothetical protein